MNDRADRPPFHTDREGIQISGTPENVAEQKARKALWERFAKANKERELQGQQQVKHWEYNR